MPIIQHPGNCPIFKTRENTLYQKFWADVEVIEFSPVWNVLADVYILYLYSKHIHKFIVSSGWSLDETTEDIWVP